MLENIVVYVEIALTIIGGATVLFRMIDPVAQSDNGNKILNFLDEILERVSLNKDKSKIEIKIK